MKEFPKLCVLALFVSVLCSCHDEDKFTPSPSATLSFSVDTVKFDTVFTSIGSTTRQFRVYNRNKDAVRTSVSMNGDFYRLNIDGVAANSFDNLEIRGNDSAFIFVEVTIDPQNTNSPLLVLDSIEFNTNGNRQNVMLMAYGQNVNLINDSLLTADTRWTSEKPYLIYNSVMVDSLCTLDIDAGSKLYFHNNSSLFVKGQLHINGTAEEPVVLQGDRFDDYYSDKPGLWGATYMINGDLYYYGNIHILNGSVGNTIDHAIIKNGIKGIQADFHTDEKLTLTLSNTIIKNMSISGIYAQNANVLVYNTVVSNCGYYAAVLSLGGNYEFVHTTLANYAPSHSMPSLLFNNYHVDSEQYVHTYDFSAIFANSIVYGSLPSEFRIDVATGAQFDFQFDNCLLKANQNDKSVDWNDTSVFNNVLVGDSALPRFVNVAEGDFHLDTLSAAKDKGGSYYLEFFPLDLDGNMRDSNPDLGAYERIEK